MELLIPNSCHKCGCIDEAKLTFAGPHVKQSCNHCGAYQKFINISLIPDAKEIKLRIWALTQDIDFINASKKEIGIAENLKGLDAKIMYWKFYMSILSRYPLP